MGESLEVKSLSQEKEIAGHLILGAALFTISYGFYLYTSAILFVIYLTSHPVDSFILPTLPTHPIIMILLGFVIAVLLSGIVNSKASKLLWSKNTNGSSRVWLSEGLLIQFITQILLYPLPALQTIISGVPLVTQPILIGLVFLMYCSFFGFVGIKLADTHSHLVLQDQKLTNSQKRPGFSGTRARCPFCGASFKYRDDDRSEDGTVKCYRCSRRFYMEPIDVLLKKLGESIDATSRIDL